MFSNFGSPDGMAILSICLLVVIISHFDLIKNQLILFFFVSLLLTSCFCDSNPS